MVLEAAISGSCRYIVTFNNETSKQRIRCPYVSSHLKNSFEQSGLSNEHTQSQAAQLSPRRDQKTGSPRRNLYQPACQHSRCGEARRPHDRGASREAGATG